MATPMGCSRPQDRVQSAAGGTWTKYRDLIRQIEAAGWTFSRMVKGDHMIFKHPTITGSVVVSGAGKLNRDVQTGTQNAVLRQAGLR